MQWDILGIVLVTFEKTRVFYVNGEVYGVHMDREFLKNWVIFQWWFFKELGDFSIKIIVGFIGFICMVIFGKGFADVKYFWDCLSNFSAVERVVILKNLSWWFVEMVSEKVLGEANNHGVFFVFLASDNFCYAKINIFICFRKVPSVVICWIKK